MKYLFDRLEQTHCVYIDQLAFLASDLLQERDTDVMEEFFDEPVETICKTLGWQPDHEKTKNYVNEHLKSSDGKSMLIDQNKFGFLAAVHFPEYKCTSLETGSISTGVCTRLWFYADTIGELVDKIVKQNEVNDAKALEKFKKEQETETN